MASIRYKSPGLAYALKGNIRYPGSQAKADALERAAEDAAEEFLGLGTTDLLNKFTITPAS